MDLYGAAQRKAGSPPSQIHWRKAGLTSDSMDMALTQLPWSIPLKSHALLSLTRVKAASLTAVSPHCPTNLTGFAPVYTRGESGSVALKALLQHKLPSAARCPREPALKPLSCLRKGWGEDSAAGLAPQILCRVSHWRFGPTNSKGLSKLSPEGQF